MMALKAAPSPPRSTQQAPHPAVFRDDHACLGGLVSKHEGTLERFVGDGRLVLFNAPTDCSDHAGRAVLMALPVCTLDPPIRARSRKGRIEEQFLREMSYRRPISIRISLSFKVCRSSADRGFTRFKSKTVIAMGNPQSVLIVDDEPNILLSLQFLMKKTGYDVRTAKDGEEALAEISRAAPDLVLLDVMMPKIDGFSVCERIRSNPEWKNIRIIMLTARGRDIERDKGLALGADDYITKPFSTQDTIARVEAVLARSRNGEAL
jgi:CheY-like chemotaxis protein